MDRHRLHGIGIFIRAENNREDSSYRLDLGCKQVCFNLSSNLGRHLGQYMKESVYSARPQLLVRTARLDGAEAEVVWRDRDQGYALS